MKETTGMVLFRRKSENSLKGVSCLYSSIKFSFSYSCFRSDSEKYIQKEDKCLKI